MMELKTAFEVCRLGGQITELLEPHPWFEAMVKTAAKHNFESYYKSFGVNRFVDKIYSIASIEYQDLYLDLTYNQIEDENAIFFELANRKDDLFNLLKLFK